MKNKRCFSGWFEISEKGDVPGQLERLRGWSRGYTPPQEQCYLPTTYFWTTWHRTSGLLISMKNENLINGLFDNSEKEDVSRHCERLQGWSSGFTLPQEDIRLPPTYFWTTWHQTRAFLIAMNNKKLFFGWFDNSEKGDVFGQLERLRGWSCGCTPPKECCRLPPTYFWTTWHQTSE
jgi:hypothetical protein